MTALDSPKTYNDAQLDQMAREVFVLAIGQAKKILNGEQTPFSPERLEALAAIANSAESAIQYDRDSSNEYE